MKNKELGNETKKLLIESIEQYFIDKETDTNSESEEWFITTKFLLEYIYRKDIQEFLNTCSELRDKNKLTRFLEVNL